MLSQQNLAELLRKAPQTPNPALATLVKALVDPALLRHKSAEIQLLTACALAEILRIYAPECPYSDRELKVWLLLLCADCFPNDPRLVNRRQSSTSSYLSFRALRKQRAHSSQAIFSYWKAVLAPAPFCCCIILRMALRLGPLRSPRSCSGCFTPSSIWARRSARARLNTVRSKYSPSASKRHKEARTWVDQCWMLCCCS